MDELFDLPPTEFIAARDALAKQLKADGDAGAAAEVKALRRPSVAAWAVNQVARRQPRSGAKNMKIEEVPLRSYLSSSRSGVPGVMGSGRRSWPWSSLLASSMTISGISSSFGSA